jgi:sugar phosphate isomerase/epimerase
MSPDEELRALASQAQGLAAELRDVRAQFAERDVTIAEMQRTVGALTAQTLERNAVIETLRRERDAAHAAGASIAELWEDE